MKNVRSRLALLLYIIVLVTALFSLLLSAMARNGILFQRDPLRWAFFGFALKDVLLLLMAIAAIIALIRITTRSTTRPIRELSQAAQAIAQGDFDITVDIKRDNVEEYGELERSFNTMTAQLRSNEYLRKDFISNVSHELKTPLSIISGYAQLLRDGGLSPEEQAEYAGYVAVESDRMVTLVDNMLRLSRIDHGEIRPKRIRFSLGEQLRRAILQLEPRWSAAGQTVDAEIADAEWVGDAELLNQVWVNLLDNAIKFSGEGGCIRVSLAAIDGGYAVTVSDNGPGMDKTALSRIFEQFYQAETAHRGEGAGLGLPLCKRIVELHGGTLAVESAPGAGTCFSVFLPG